MPRFASSPQFNEFPINAQRPINNTVDLLERDGQTWLKTGVIETDGTKYPDASSGGTYNYTGTNFSTSGEGVSSGLGWDGTHFWTVVNATDSAYQYDASGVYTGFSFASQDATPTDITFDGTDFWISGNSSNSVHSYTALGAYTGTNFSVGAQDTSPVGLVWDGTFFWVAGSNSSSVYQYDAGWVYTGFSFDVSANTSFGLVGLTFHNGNLWVVSSASDAAFEYTTAGTYTGVTFATTSSPQDITSDGAALWVVDSILQDVRQYVSSVGDSTPHTDTDSQLPIYLRVK